MEIIDTIRKVQVKLNLLQVDWINGSDIQHFSYYENIFVVVRLLLNWLIKYVNQKMGFGSEAACSL